MADYASDPKVEDVLSSVRRLVSQEIPKRPAAKPEADDGALLLTSKDRISEEHGARVAAKSLEQRIAELEKERDELREKLDQYPMDVQWTIASLSTERGRTSRGSIRSAGTPSHLRRRP